MRLTGVEGNGVGWGKKYGDWRAIAIQVSWRKPWYQIQTQRRFSTLDL